MSSQVRPILKLFVRSAVGTVRGRQGVYLGSIFYWRSCSYAPSAAVRAIGDTIGSRLDSRRRLSVQVKIGAHKCPR